MKLRGGTKIYFQLIETFAKARDTRFHRRLVLIILLGHRSRSLFPAHRFINAGGRQEILSRGECQIPSPARMAEKRSRIAPGSVLEELDQAMHLGYCKEGVISGEYGLAFWGVSDAPV